MIPAVGAPKPNAWSGPVAIGSAVAYEVRVIGGVERFNPRNDAHALIEENEGAFDEGREVVDRAAVARVAAHYDAIDHRAVGSGAIAAVVGAGDVIEGQARGAASERRPW